ncbi:Nucleoporin Nup85-like protein, partial [Aduncisulcus paluster]
MDFIEDNPFSKDVWSVLNGILFTNYRDDSLDNTVVLQCLYSIYKHKYSDKKKQADVFALSCLGRFNEASAILLEMSRDTVYFDVSQTISDLLKKCPIYSPKKYPHMFAFGEDFDSWRKLCRNTCSTQSLMNPDSKPDESGFSSDKRLRNICTALLQLLNGDHHYNSKYIQQTPWTVRLGIDMLFGDAYYTSKISFYNELMNMKTANSRDLKGTKKDPLFDILKACVSNDPKNIQNIIHILANETRFHFHNMCVVCNALYDFILMKVIDERSRDEKIKETLRLLRQIKSLYMLKYVRKKVIEDYTKLEARCLSRPKSDDLVIFINDPQGKNKQLHPDSLSTIRLKSLDCFISGIHYLRHLEFFDDASVDFIPPFSALSIDKIPEIGSELDTAVSDLTILLESILSLARSVCVTIQDHLRYISVLRLCRVSEDIVRDEMSLFSLHILAKRNPKHFDKWMELKHKISQTQRGKKTEEEDEEGEEDGIEGEEISSSHELLEISM